MLRIRIKTKYFLAEIRIDAAMISTLIQIAVLVGTYLSSTSQIA
jgi:hypothetical protein